MNTAPRTCDLETLCRTVQGNCNISDARHASDYTLCIYLLKMREYFRWEQGYRFGDTLPQAEVSQWLSTREQLWDDIEDQTYTPLAINGIDIDPFDTDLINQSLIPQGYVYSAGVGPRSTEHFFMAELISQKNRDGYSILIAGKECARDIAALPAMCTDETIFVRRESLKRMLWETYNEWHWNQSSGLLEKAFSFYDFNADLDKSLEQMCEVEIDTLITHEIGELKAREKINHERSPSAWHEMLTNLPRSRAEISARAVKDHLADTLYTLPELIKKRRTQSLSFYIAHLPPLHKHIFPSLIEAAQKWQTNDDLNELKQVLGPATKHWFNTACEILDLFSSSADDTQIVTLIESRRL